MILDLLNDDVARELGRVTVASAQMDLTLAIMLAILTGTRDADGRFDGYDLYKKPGSDVRKRVRAGLEALPDGAWVADTVKLIDDADALLGERDQAVHSFIRIGVDPATGDVDIVHTHPRSNTVRTWRPDDLRALSLKMTEWDDAIARRLPNLQFQTYERDALGNP